MISLSLFSNKMMIWSFKFLLIRYLVAMYMTVFFMVIDTQDLFAAVKRAFPVISRGL
jgi:hypothetical protein